MSEIVSVTPDPQLWSTVLAALAEAGVTDVVLATDADAVLVASVPDAPVSAFARVPAVVDGSFSMLRAATARVAALGASFTASGVTLGGDTPVRASQLSGRFPSPIAAGRGAQTIAPELIAWLVGAGEPSLFADAGDLVVLDGSTLAARSPAAFREVVFRGAKLGNAAFEGALLRGIHTSGLAQLVPVTVSSESLTAGPLSFAVEPGRWMPRSFVQSNAQQWAGKLNPDRDAGLVTVDPSSKTLLTGQTSTSRPLLDVEDVLEFVALTAGQRVSASLDSRSLVLSAAAGQQRLVTVVPVQRTKTMLAGLRSQS